jgi:glycosyltransferase involved in cell wall biosynthesis
MKKIRILYTIPNFDTAGSGKVVHDLIKYLDKNTFEVFLMCNHSKGLLFEAIQELDVHITIQQVSFPLTPYVSLFRRIGPYKEFIRKNKIDVVHSWHWSSDWTEALAVRLAGSKFVYTKKAMSWGNRHWKIKSILANYIITINHEMRHFFPWKKQQSLIPLGLDTNYYAPESDRQIRSENTFRIITIANLVPVKGIEFLIQALYHLNNQNMVLDIIGDTRDSYVRGLEALVETLSLKNQVSFKGKHTDVRPFFGDADLYVIPTRNMGRKEGMPMALVEAMSMGVPVIGSNISGINYVLKDFPELIFEPDNVVALANKIQLIYHMNLSERMVLGNKLRTYVMDRFSMDTFVRSHEALYSKLTLG